MTAPQYLALVPQHITLALQPVIPAQAGISRPRPKPVQLLPAHTDLPLLPVRPEVLEGRTAHPTKPVKPLQPK